MNFTLAYAQLPTLTTHAHDTVTGKRIAGITHIGLYHISARYGGNRFGRCGRARRSLFSQWYRALPHADEPASTAHAFDFSTGNRIAGVNHRCMVLILRWCQVRERSRCGARGGDRILSGAARDRTQTPRRHPHMVMYLNSDTTACTLILYAYLTSVSAAVGPTSRCCGCNWNGWVARPHAQTRMTRRRIILPRHRCMIRSICHSQTLSICLAHACEC